MHIKELFYTQLTCMYACVSACALCMHYALISVVGAGLKSVVNLFYQTWEKCIKITLRIRRGIPIATQKHTHQYNVCVELCCTVLKYIYALACVCKYIIVFAAFFYLLVTHQRRSSASV